MASPPLERVLPLEEREKVRQSWMGEAGWYSPALHLGGPALFAGVVIGAAASLIHDVRWWEIAFGLALFVLANAAEWRIHTGLLHRRFRPAAALYDRHTPQHHMVFITDDMALRSPQEFRMVLLPPYAIVALVVLLSPATLGLWFSGRHNLAAIFAIVTTGYVIVYEFLHLAYHLPRHSLIGSLGLVRVLSRHHAIHHDPRLMQRWNMNVSLPLWDLVRGTSVRSREQVLGVKATSGV